MTNHNTAVLFIDFQERMMPAIANGAQITDNACILAKASALLQLPVFVTRQYPKGLGDTVPELLEALGVHDVSDKTAFSCMGDEGFAAKLADSGRKNIIVAGVEAHICVQQTVLDLLELKYNVYLLADCIGSRKDASRLYAERRMERAGAVVTTMESVLFEVMRDKEHPARKDVQNLIK